MSRDLSAIVLDAAESLRPLLQEAFESGRAVGREEASNELRAKLTEAFGVSVAVPASTVPSVVEPKPVRETSDNTQRAAPGTVKPVIRRLIENNPEGMTTEQITTATGIKHNSVRGTLHTLKQEGVIDRRGNKWIPIPLIAKTPTGVQPAGASLFTDEGSPPSSSQTGER